MYTYDATYIQCPSLIIIITLYKVLPMWYNRNDKVTGSYNWEIHLSHFTISQIPLMTNQLCMNMHIQIFIQKFLFSKFFLLFSFDNHISITRQYTGFTGKTLHNHWNSWKAVQELLTSVNKEKQKFAWPYIMIQTINVF